MHIGDPTKSYSTTWSFEADNFTNEWFELDNGYEVVMLAATTYMAMDLKDDHAAQLWLSQKNDELASVTIQNERRQATGHVAAWF